ncbi:Glycerophosphocholine phosphodiesterase [Coemansia sp. RSA 986]|nr:Glycerophosphocholine phosphodiesterase [Coemansia sp. RSA 986]
MYSLKLDQYQLGPRFYRLELDRAVAMRRLALQKYPLELADVSKDVLSAMESVAQAVIEYSEQLAFETRKVATSLKTIESMSSSTRIGQILALIESLETRLQSLIRYGWLIEREWNVYVKEPVAIATEAATAMATDDLDNENPNSRRLFPHSFLRDLDTWHMMLSKAIVRVRIRFNNVNHSQKQRTAAAESVPAWDALAAVQTLSPHQWSTEYILEKYKSEKSEKAKKKRHDIWLDAVPQVTGTRPGQKSSLQLTDICRRNALHYAAHSATDLAQLKRFHDIDMQDLHQRRDSAYRTPAIATRDLFGDTPLTVAVAGGNAGAVSYILEEANVEDVQESLADAAVIALTKGSESCLGCIVKYLVKQPEQVALAIRLSMFYGLEELFMAICTALTTAGASACSDAEAALEQSAQRAGGSTILHLAVLNGWSGMVKSALEQQILRSTEFNAQSRDDAWLTPLDIANFFGYRACADQLVNTFTFFCPPLALNFDPEDEALRVKPFAAKTKETRTPPDAYAVFAVLGTNDLRRSSTMPPISIDAAALHSVLDEMELPRSTHLVLRMDSEQGIETGDADGWVTDVTSLVEAPNLLSYIWQPPAHFYTMYPERFVLRLDLVALVDQALSPHADDRRVVAQAAVPIPPTFVPANSERIPGSYAPVCPAAGSYFSAVFTSPATGQTVAKADIEVVVAAPYKRNAGQPADSLCVPSGSAYATKAWQEPGQSLVYGHRGSGMNFAPNGGPQKLQLGENTVLSMQQAIRDGVSGIEFDVQMTRDMVPVIYHDWTMAETGMDIPISSLTLKQFCAANPRNRRQPRRARSTETLPRPAACGLVSSCDPAQAEDDNKPPVHIANSANTVQAPLATLEDLFRSLPEDMGFDIEIKYPMPDEADTANVFTNFEINLFVDKILDVVYKYDGAEKSRRQRRPIVFTSFHPDICLLLAHKINNDIPIMLLTDAGMSEMADCRCNSIDAAVRLCNWAGLAGIVTHVAPISQSPRVALLMRRHQLALATYGTPANQPEHVRQQQAYGVDIIIVDDVRTARSAIDAGDDAWR